MYGCILLISNRPDECSSNDSCKGRYFVSMHFLIVDYMFKDKIDYLLDDIYAHRAGGVLIKLNFAVDDDFLAIFMYAYTFNSF